MGKGEHPACNPPEISQSDRDALVFYNTYATGFASDFGLMPIYLSRLKMSPDEEWIFFEKLSVIHEARMMASMKERNNG
jgi:hypothetical protein